MPLESWGHGDAIQVFRRCVQGSLLSALCQESLALIELARTGELSGKLRTHRSIVDGAVVLDRIAPVYDLLSPATRRGIEDLLPSIGLKSYHSMFRDKLVIKEAGCPGYALHKDGDFWADQPGTHRFTIGIAIDNQTVDAGPLVFPSTGGDEMNAEPLTAGDAVVFGETVLHWSGPNVTNSLRRVLYLSFCHRS